jgi:GTP-binding protein HflX
VAQGTVETQKKPVRAFLVSAPSGARGAKHDAGRGEAASLARELEGLVHSLGLEIIAHEALKVREWSSAYGMGSGKARELAEKATGLEADCMVFDWDPSPTQQRNWEALAGIPVVDRQELIIRIFAERASTREAELQVRLAELSYSLPRLTHKYIDLSRQRGGRYGTRGSGETRLELDRRQVEQRIRRLEGELEDVRRQRQVQRRQRERQGIPVCALVGYTNAGKSSLMSALSGAELAAEDKLFVTLDAASRRFELSRGLPVLLVDTVGFIRNLPHALINAFRSTLEEAALADLLIHVVDASDPDMERHYETTLGVLEELGAAEVPAITVLNKIDRLPAEHDAPAPALIPDATLGAIPDSVPAVVPGAIPISVRRGWGLEELRERMRKLLSGARIRFRFPPDRGDLVGMLHRSAQVFSEDWDNDGILVEAWADGKLSGQLRQYLV